jgi:hypothetical protein
MHKLSKKQSPKQGKPDISTSKDPKWLGVLKLVSISTVIGAGSLWLTYQNNLPSLAVTMDFAKPVVPGEMIVVKGCVKNTGSSTARRLQFFNVGFGVVPSTQKPNVNLNATVGVGLDGTIKPIPKGDVSDLGPGQERLFANTSGVMFEGPGYESWLSGKTLLYAWGKLKYQDSLYRSREACFCRVATNVPALSGWVFARCDALVCK